MITKYHGKAFDVVQVGDREYVTRPDASAVLLINKKGEVLLVEQERGPFGIQLEIPAGKVESNESPLIAAIRELREETGCKVLSMEYLCSYYPSVGYTNEKVHLFVSVLKEEGVQDLDEGEKINLRWMNTENLIEYIDFGIIRDSKTIIALYRFFLLRKETKP